MSKEKFYEILKDPYMAEWRETLVEMVKNPKNEIVSVEHDDYGTDPTKITIVLRSHDE